LCEEHAFIIEQLIRTDEGKGFIAIEVPKPQPLMLADGITIDEEIIEDET
jgi:hypothetical protein